MQPTCPKSVAPGDPSPLDVVIGVRVESSITTVSGTCAEKDLVKFGLKSTLLDYLPKPSLESHTQDQPVSLHLQVRLAIAPEHLELEDVVEALLPIIARNVPTSLRPLEG